MESNKSKIINVLLVDDATAVVEYVRSLLSDSANIIYKMKSVDSLDSAFRILRVFECDIILLDLNIKDSSGLDTYIRMKQKYPNVPAIVITGEYKDDIGGKVISMGAQDFLIKSKLDPYTLNKAIKYAIERKNVEKELLESEARWRSLVQNTSDIIMNLDQSGKILFINRNTSRISIKESLGKEIYKFISPANHDKIKKAIDAVFKSGMTTSVEITEIQEDETVWNSVKLGPITQNNHVIAANMTITDITEQRRREEELSTFHKLVETSVQGIGWVEMDGTIKYVNQFLCKLMGGNKPEDVYRKNITQYYDKETQKRFLEEIHPRVMAQGNWSGELTLISLNGEKVPTFNNIILLRDSYGAPVFLGNLVIDITERKKELEERILLEKQLRQSRTLESIGTLASGIAHEINTPIQYIHDNTLFFSEGVINLFELINKFQNLLSSCKDADTEIILDGMSSILKEADMEYLRQEIPSAISQSLEGIDRVKKIINAMKFFSHVDAEEMKKANINQAIESSILVSKNEWKYVADIKTELDAGLPEINCYIGGINQVMMNLIVNAAHAIEEVRGKGGEGKGIISVFSWKENGSIVITVKDSGCGIPDEIKDRIFDPFFTTKDVGKGTGQGLSIVYDIIVNRHKGSILVDSKVGEGSSFSIRLPILQDQ